MTPAWMSQAACIGMEPDAFFPTKGTDTNTVAARAKAVCARCPVINNCLDYAMRNQQPFGVWGGFSAEERARIRRRRVVGA